MANFASAKNNMTIAYNNGVTADNLIPLLTCTSGGLEFAIESGNTIFTADLAPPEGFDTESITAALGSFSIVNTLIYYRAGYGSENISALLNAISVVVTNTGGSPL